MLVLTRRPGEDLLLFPNEGLDPDTTVAELFAEGPVRIRFVGSHRRAQARIGVEAPAALVVLRDEIL